jgi:hypothetical protein
MILRRPPKAGPKSLVETTDAPDPDRSAVRDDGREIDEPDQHGDAAGDPDELLQDCAGVSFDSHFLLSSFRSPLGVIERGGNDRSPQLERNAYARRPRVRRSAFSQVGRIFEGF